MVPMMNNEFDLEKKEESQSRGSQVEKKSRVLNDENGHVVDFDNGSDVNNIDEKVGDLHSIEEIRVSSEQDLGFQNSEFDENRISRVSDGETEVKVNEMESSGFDDGIEVKNEESKDVVRHIGKKARRRSVHKDEVSDRSENRATNVDDEVGTNSNSLKVLDTKFEIGDMVWGKVKSHPWWPGHLFNEAFATTSVQRTRRHGHVLVAFFGDSSYGWFDPAELLPYDPHYAEKSEQTTSKNFVRAVEESVDEASRRSALGLSCRCRNPSNFRSVNVPGYVAVDVVDYDPNSIYSLSQIQRARDDFRPFNTLSFIKQLAVAPMSGESKNLDFIKNKAATLAYRRSIFEENDETYAEAFNQHQARHTQALSSKEPTKAPLSGPLVMADTLGGKKSSSKSTKTKEQLKKDKYLLKRRDKGVEDGASDMSASNYVLQKREPSVSIDESNEVAPSPYMGPTKDVPVTVMGAILPSSSILTPDLGNVPEKVPEGHLGMKEGIIKKKKAIKRPIGEHSLEKSDRPEKKMKKVKKKDGHMSIDHSKGDSVTQLKKDTSTTNLGTSHSDSELPQILADLRALALNPVHAIERSGPAISRQFFLKFRSLVYVKSSNSSAQPESESSEARAIKSEVSEKPSMEEGGKIASSLKTQKLFSKSKDPSKVRKRFPSERQEENAAKRAKKITQVKSLSSEKRALLKNPELQNRSESKPKITPLQQNSQSNTIIKSENPDKKMDRPPRVEDPTFLFMKFPPGSALPSLVQLKARFARFGPLDVSLSRVFYKTNSCRVAFLYKQDANVAYRYAMGSKSLFSNVKFLLKPVTPPEPLQASSSKVEEVQTESGPSRDSPLPDEKPTTHQAGPTQLKSCLKKPLGGDDNGGTHLGGGNGRTTRVRFNMEEVKGGSSDSKVGLQGPKMESRNSILSSSESQISPSSSSIAMDSNSSNNQRLNVSLQISQPPLLPLPPQFIRTPINHQFHHHHNMVESHSKINVHENIPKIIPPPPQPPLTENEALAPPPEPTIDISQQMMSLLTKCHDVVTNVKNILGHIPYHPL